MKLVFGDMGSKQRLIDAIKAKDKFETQVERAVMAMANFTNLPLTPRGNQHLPRPRSRLRTRRSSRSRRPYSITPESVTFCVNK